MREAILTCSRHLPQEQEQRAIPYMVLNGNYFILLSCSVFASVQIRALRSNCLSLPDTTTYRRPKGLGKKPSSSLSTIITSSTLSLQVVLFLQPSHYQCAATYSTHPLPSQRKFPLSLFFSEPLFNAQATASILLSAASGKILFVF